MKPKHIIHIKATKIFFLFSKYILYTKPIRLLMGNLFFFPFLEVNKIANDIIFYAENFSWKVDKNP